MVKFAERWNSYLDIHLFTLVSLSIPQAKKVHPRPLNSLRPVVRCTTIKYNQKVRAGRGFTLDELRVCCVGISAFALHCISQYVCSSTA